MVNFSKFDEKREVNRRTIYFLVNKSKLHAVPDFKTDEEIKDFLKGRRNNSKVFLMVREIMYPERNSQKVANLYDNIYA